MITEIAIFTALPGKEEALGQGISQGLTAIRQHTECLSCSSEMKKSPVTDSHFHP